jgi:hypothetical protein
MGRRRRFRTPSHSSPKNSRRGCLCPDGTYSTKCCDGSLQAQGIGSLKGQNTSDITQVEDERTIINSRG